MDLQKSLFEMGANGINLWDINICTLLCAGDLVVIADNETYLKLQMNILGHFTNRFKIDISPKKTKVMIFHEKNKAPNETTFSSIGKHQIKLINQYKYLGVILDNKGSFKNHAEMLVEKAVYFCKLTLGVKPSKPMDGIYAELGRYPLKIFRQIQMVKFASNTNLKLKDVRDRKILYTDFFLKVQYTIIQAVYYVVENR